MLAETLAQHWQANIGPADFLSSRPILAQCWLPIIIHWQANIGPAEFLSNIGTMLATHHHNSIGPTKVQNKISLAKMLACQCWPKLAANIGPAEFCLEGQYWHFVG